MHSTRHDDCFRQHLCITRHDAGLRASKNPAAAALGQIAAQPPREGAE